MTDYSRGDYADLPAGTTDLENNYTAPDLTAIASNDNSTYAEQTANNEIAIHQYKKTVTGQYTNITWSGKSSLAPSESPVIMEVYNVNGTAWEELDRDDSTAADTDFDIIYNNLATADYLDNGVITWRVYQAASGAAPSWVFFANHIANKSIDSLITKDGAWHAVSSLTTAGIVPAGTTGVILHLTNSHETDTATPVDFRPTGSTYTRTDSDLNAQFHKYDFVRVDANGVFDARIMSSICSIYVLGYTIESLEQFYDNPTDIKPGTYDGGYYEVDRTVGAASICRISNGDLNWQTGWRKFGSTYSNYWYVAPNVPALALLPLDSSFRGEIALSSENGVWNEWGYTNKFVENSANTDKTPTAGSWQVVDVSDIAPSNAVGVVCTIKPDIVHRRVNLRNLGDSDNYTDVPFRVYGGRLLPCYAGLSVDKKFEAYMDSADDLVLYVVGFLLA